MKSRILVVDDDPSILELLRFLLEGEGYRVQAFGSATDALKAAIAHPPDVAIIDLMMPGMNGLELVQAFRYDSRTQHVPVLLCSAYYGDLRHITTNLNLKNIFSLRKPFQIHDLLDSVVKMAVDNRQHARNGTAGTKRKMAGEKQAIPPEPVFMTKDQGNTTPTLVPFSAFHHNRGNSTKVQDAPQDAPGIAAGQSRGRRG